MLHSGVFSVIRAFVMMNNMIYLIIGIACHSLGWYLNRAKFPSKIIEVEIKQVKVPPFVKYITSLDIQSPPIEKYVYEIMKPVYEGVITISAFMVLISFFGLTGVLTCFRLIILFYICLKCCMCYTIHRIESYLYAIMVKKTLDKLRDSFWRYTCDIYTDVDTVMWTGLQFALKCCGIDGTSDYYGHPNFPTAPWYMKPYYWHHKRPYVCSFGDEEGCFIKIRNAYKGLIDDHHHYFTFLFVMHLVFLSIDCMLLLSVYCCKKSLARHRHEHQRKLQPRQQAELLALMRTHPCYIAPGPDMASGTVPSCSCHVKIIV